MLKHFYYFLEYIKILYTFGLITCLYSPFYKKCNQKVKIKTKSGKIKDVIKTKICLSLLYLFLIVIFYYNLTWKVLLTIGSFLFISGLYLLDNFYPSSICVLNKFDSNIILRYLWKFFSTIITLSLLFYRPIIDGLENYFNNKIKTIKSLFNNVLLNNSNDMGLINIYDQIANNIDDKSKEKSNKKSNNKSSKKSNKKTENSEFSDYVIKSSKNNNLELVTNTECNKLSKSKLDIIYENNSKDSILVDKTQDKNNNVLKMLKEVNEIFESNDMNIEDIITTDNK